MRQGRSGAVVALSPGGTRVLKVAPAGPVQHKLLLQGDWLAYGDHPACFPQRIELLSNGYSMERLSPLPPFVDWLAVTQQTVDCLSSIWLRPAEEHLFRAAEHERYVGERSADLTTDDRTKLRAWFREVLGATFESAHPCEVHGDPTLDNLMLRPYTSELVITDPVPVTDARLPSVRALDIGKIVQSVMGYEHHLHGWPRTAVTLHDLEGIVSLPEVEWQQSLYLAAVHFTLLRRYSPERDSTWQRTIHKLLEMRDDSWK